jgi:hypothetical protein
MGSWRLRAKQRSLIKRHISPAARKLHELWRSGARLSATRRFEAQDHMSVRDASAANRTASESLPKRAERFCSALMQ